MFNWDGENAIVTGGSKGIGAAIAKSLGAAGANVGVNYLPTESDRGDADNVVDVIQQQGSHAIPLAGDVSDAESVRSMVEIFETDIGRVSILVNNAGVISASPLAEMPPKMWDELMSVNLRGAFLTTRYTLPSMLERDSGKIINIASQLGIVGSERLVHYCAAKGGLIAFTRALAHELAPDVNVNAIAPGAIRTDLGSNLSEEDSRSLSEIPLQRYGNVEDIAPTAVFLASEAADYYTGQTLSPDGGDAMH